MMAYKLAKDKPDYFAALFVVGASYGGHGHAGFGSLVEHDLQGTSYAISLFSVHGNDDVTIPRGSGTTGVTGSATYKADLEAAGVPTDEALDVAPAYRTMGGVLDEYRSYDGMPSSPASTSTTEDDVSGGTTSTRVTWKRSGGASNPMVVGHTDPEWDGDEAEFVGANRYITTAEVWNWLKNHPRTT
jgi:poly(3-hydroxybutyrate) depolymerase